SMSVEVSFFTCVYQSPVCGSTIARRASRSSSCTSHCSPRWRYTAPSCTVALDDAEHGARVAVDDGEGVGARRAQRRARGGIVLAGPDPAVLRVLELRDVRRAFQRLVAQRCTVGVVDRRLERGGGDVPVEHARIRVIEDRRLDAAAEQLLGLAHEVLVERVLRRDEHSEAVPPAPGAAPLLAQARNRPRKADRDRAVEQTDVDAELERVCCSDAEKLAL